MLRVVPISIKQAKEFVARLHRHHKPPQGAKFAIGCTDGKQLVGVVMVGRPVARMLDDGQTAEVTRLCTDGAPNACSMLYGAAARAAKAMGYKCIITYTLPEEGGASLRASNWRMVGYAGGGTWDRPNRKRTDKHPTTTKIKWELVLN